jgi:uncharacterized protein (TIGR03435 family)
MTRGRLLVIVAALTVFAPLAAQKPSFEAASIKRNLSGGKRGSTQLRPGGRLVVANENLRSMIKDAYGEGRFDVVGGPAWLDTDAWDVAATAGREVRDDDVWAMVRTLLEDRFTLVARVETQEQPVYAIVRANADGRLGPQLKASSTPCPPAGNLCGTQSATGRIRGTAAAIDDLARSLRRVVGRQVTNDTRLDGRFDFTLSWEQDSESVFTAIREQLGLKLDPRRGPVRVVVVDRVERPVED